MSEFTIIDKVLKSLTTPLKLDGIVFTDDLKNKLNLLADESKEIISQNKSDCKSPEKIHKLLHEKLIIKDSYVSFYFNIIINAIILALK